MKKRPIAVTILSWLYIVVGIAGLAFHLSQYKLQHPFEYDIVWIAVVEILAVIAGVYMLRGSNWARWLAVTWMALHVGISFFDWRNKLAVHLVLFGLITYALFRADAREYFCQREKKAY